MKTTTQNQLAFISKITLIATFILATFTSVSAQENLIPETKSNPSLLNVGINSSVSGNSFGVYRTVFASINIGNKFELSTGASFNKRDFRFTGLQSRLAYYFLRPDNSFSGKTSLYGLLVIDNHINQSFSKGWVETEKWVNRKTNDAGTNYNEIRFKGIEAALGFGVSHSVKRLTFNLNIGLTVHRVERINHQHTKLYFQQTGSGLHLSTGIKFAL